MNNNQPKGFFDKNTLIAVALVVITWTVWNNYMQNKYPDHYNKDKKTEQVQTTSNDKVQSLDGQTAPAVTEVKTVAKGSSSKNSTNKALTVNEELIQLDNEYFSLDVSSKGMGFKNIVLKKYKDREMGAKKLGSSQKYSVFETRLRGKSESLDFKITSSDSNTLIGVAQVDGMTLTKEISVDPENYSFKSRVTISSVAPTFLGVSTYFSDLYVEQEDSSMFSMLAGQDMFVHHNDEEDRIKFTDVIEDGGSQFKNLHFTTLNSQYFTLAFVDNSDVKPELIYTYNKNTKEVVNEITHLALTQSSVYKTESQFFIGPKVIKKLEKVDADLADIIDFGWFHPISVFLFKLLDFFHGILGNWGFAIIALTFLVRLFILPLHIKSHRSMKVMQDVQPQIKAVKEKFKDDPQKMNLAVMQIMKDNNANPLKGCLPMFLQFPIFIALYRVFGQSIELYQAPFILWIQDLSLKDPYYVLPVVMSVAMFFQMQITPTAGDPMQKKMMKFMPLMFGFFMLSLPSGLTLYMAVSAIFTIIQYILFLREKKTA